MKRAGLLLGMVACGSSRPPAPAETNVVATATPTVTLDAAPAPDAHVLTPAELGLTEPPSEARSTVTSADGWSGCIIAVKDLHEHTGPKTGEVLAAWRVVGDRSYSTTSRLVVRLPTAPTPGKPIATEGQLTDQIDEQERTVEATERVDLAIVVSQIDASYDITVSHEGMPYHDSATRHFAVAVKRVHDADDCD
jgi:hypothetical protein